MNTQVFRFEDFEKFLKPKKAAKKTVVKPKKKTARK